MYFESGEMEVEWNMGRRKVGFEEMKKIQKYSFKNRYWNWLNVKKK
jgi:ABC-type antimicrobial peptide transport system ATPase subunit